MIFNCEIQVVSYIIILWFHTKILIFTFQGFTRGSTMIYQLSTVHSLGQLHYIRIWHDSSGKGKWADWFLSEIGIQDLQTNERYDVITLGYENHVIHESMSLELNVEWQLNQRRLLLISGPSWVRHHLNLTLWLFSYRYNFIVKDWLSLTQGDGKVERLVSLAGNENLKDNDRLFSAWTRAKLFDDVSSNQKNNLKFFFVFLWYNDMIMSMIKRHVTRSAGITGCICKVRRVMNLTVSISLISILTMIFSMRQLKPFLGSLIYYDRTFDKAQPSGFMACLGFRHNAS